MYNGEDGDCRSDEDAAAAVKKTAPPSDDRGRPSDFNDVADAVRRSSVVASGHRGAETASNRPDPSESCSIDLDFADDEDDARVAAEAARSISDDAASAHTCMSALSLAAEGEFDDEHEFVWEDYLMETKAQAAGATSFKHVECSLQSGFEKGMKLEVLNKVPENSYWTASIVMTCGQLLRLRPEGCGENGSFDFWCDVLSHDVHRLGWCDQNGKTLCPSEELEQRFPLTDWKSILESSLVGANTPPLYMLDQRTGTLPIDQIKEGMYLEVQLHRNPHLVWPVKVIENVGGRLLLRYEALDTATDDFWLFYLHPRLHPVGWCRANDCKYQPPEVVVATNANIDFDYSQHLETNLEYFEKNQPPAEIFKDQPKIKCHSFNVGWKLEAVHPVTLATIHPATVTSIVDGYYFVVELDVLEEDSKDCPTFCAHSSSLNIFPVGWSSSNGVKLAGKDFDWTIYLNEHSATAAPKEAFCSDLDVDLLGFEPGMKLEAVDVLRKPSQICVATVSSVVGRVMWIRLDHDAASAPDRIVALDSFDVFPIGWCESNNFPLKAPKFSAGRRLAPHQSERHLEDEARSALYLQMKEADLKKSSGWCPKIYFNYRCYTGRYLSKGRLVLLPRFEGPGSVVLVMTTILSKLINAAYKSSRVLRELQLKGRPNPNMHQQLLRAKYKGKSYSAVVEICTSSDQVVEFCREICRRLECCPNLISPHSYSTVCPENCFRLSKNKYTYYFGQKKRKVGRPAGGHSNLDFGAKKPLGGKRKRHRKLLLTLRKKHGLVGRVGEDCDSNSAGSVAENDGGGGGKEAVLRTSRKRKEPTTTDIQTRGIKLPKYSFERRTHKKVLLQTSTSNNDDERPPTTRLLKTEDVLKLKSNPLFWTIKEVVEYIKTTDCAPIARLFWEQEIDGQSLLLLSLPTIQEHLEPKLGPAVKLCHQIERLKIAFYHHYA